MMKQGMKTSAVEEGIWVLREKALGRALAVRACAAVYEDSGGPVGGSGLYGEHDGRRRATEGEEGTIWGPCAGPSGQYKMRGSGETEQEFAETRWTKEALRALPQTNASGKENSRGISCSSGQCQKTGGAPPRPRLVERFFPVDAHAASNSEPAPTRLRRAIHMATCWFRQKKLQRAPTHVEGAGEQLRKFRPSGRDSEARSEVLASAPAEEGNQHTELLFPVSVWSGGGGLRPDKGTRLQPSRKEVSEATAIDLGRCQSAVTAVGEPRHEPATARGLEQEEGRAETTAGATSGRPPSAAVGSPGERGCWAGSQLQVDPGPPPDNAKGGRRRSPVTEEQKETDGECPSVLPTTAAEGGSTSRVYATRSRLAWYSFTCEPT